MASTDGYARRRCVASRAGAVPTATSICVPPARRRRRQQMHPSVFVLAAVVVISLWAVNVVMVETLDRYVRARGMRPSSGMDRANADGILNDVDAPRYDFDHVWPRMKRRLCPAGTLKPNTRDTGIGRQLFRLARQELLQDPDMLNHSRTYTVDRQSDRVVPSFGSNLVSPTEAYIDSFFSGDFGGGSAVTTSVLMDGTADTRTPYPTRSIASIVYLRMWKCGNDLIRTWMNETLPADIRRMSVPPNARVRAKTVQFKSYREVRTKTGSSETASQATVVSTASSNALRILPQCIVIAIRDPVEHFLSGYNEIEYYIEWPEAPERSFLNIEAARTSFVRRQLGTVDRFKHFVWDVVHASFAGFTHYTFAHIFPTSRVLSQLDFFGLQLDGYLPTLHNITHTWPDFVGRTCRRSFPQSIVGSNDSNAVPTLSPLPVGKGQHSSSKDPYGTYQAAKDVWREQGPVSRALCVLHAYDYACWESLPDGVPLLCQEVYMSDAFRGIFGESG